MILCAGAEVERATAIAQRLCDALRVPFATGASMVGLGASSGIALAHPGDRPDQVLSRADAAVYRATRSPEQQVLIWSGGLAELR